MPETKTVFCLERRLVLIGLFGCCLLLAIAYYAEFVKGLEPCPLCIMQRICLILLAFIFLTASLLRPSRIYRWIYTIPIFLISLLGAGVAGRQVWLELQPSGSENICLPGMDYISQLPSSDILRLLFQGSASCGIVHWRILGVSVAAWTLVCFILLTALGLWLFLHKKSRHQQLPHHSH